MCCDPDDFQSRDQAVKPADPVAAQAAVASAIKRQLIDPESAQFEYQPAVRSLYAGREVLSGWFMCGLVNSKNRMGGYAGRKPFLAHFNPADPATATIVWMEEAESDFFYVTGACEDVYGAATETMG